jgi:hypothetical protein
MPYRIVVDGPGFLKECLPPHPPVIVKRGWKMLRTKDRCQERLKKRQDVVENIEGLFPAKWRR